MALIVKLSTNTELYGSEYYDSLSGITLTESNPQSSDLSGLASSQLTYIIGAVNDGRLVLVSGTLPVPSSNVATTVTVTNFPNTQALSNYPIAAGASSGMIVLESVSAKHLYSVTVTPNAGDASNLVTITDGSGGALLAVIPANFPGGDISLTAPKSFSTSIYINTTGNSPAFSIGVGP